MRQVNVNIFVSVSSADKMHSGKGIKDQQGRLLRFVLQRKYVRKLCMINMRYTLHSTL